MTRYSVYFPDWIKISSTVVPVGFGRFIDFFYLVGTGGVNLSVGTTPGGTDILPNTFVSDFVKVQIGQKGLFFVNVPPGTAGSIVGFYII